MILKKIHLVLLMFIGFSALGQKNSIKVNLSGIPLNLYSVQYERMLTNKFSLNNTFFYRDKIHVPFGHKIDALAKNHGVGLTGIRFDYIFMDEATMGFKGYSPEFRYYMGSSKHRPFVGIYGLYQDFDLQVPALINVKGLDVKVPIDFTFSTLSGGLLIGKQFKWKRVGLDIVVIGGHIGRANDFLALGTNSNIQGLSESDKNQVKAGIRERFGLSDKYFQMDIFDTNAQIVSVKPIPYVGVRGAGFNLSFNF